MRIIRALLDGADAAPGRVAAADVARVITGLERAVAIAAYGVLGRARRGSGRHVQAIESAARLRFVGVDEDGFGLVLALSEVGEPGEDELPIPVVTLSSLAFDRVLDVIADNEDPDVEPELAGAVAQLAVELGIGGRNDAVTFADAVGRAGFREATVDLPVRERLGRHAPVTGQPRSETLVGTLVEADFEQFTARLRLSDRSAVSVEFAADLADAIQDGLRHSAQVKGLVSYHARTSQAVSVELRAVSRGDQLMLLED